MAIVLGQELCKVGAVLGGGSEVVRTLEMNKCYSFILPFVMSCSIVYMRSASLPTHANCVDIQAERDPHEWRVDHNFSQ